jgi:hypothetical protein
MQRPNRNWGPPSSLSNENRGLKQQEREDDHSPLCISEDKNAAAIPPRPHIIVRN